MKLIRGLSTAMLLLIPGAIIPAFAQEHEQEKQPEQKQQQAKPAQHQQQVQHQEQAKPAPKPQQAQHEEHAKPAQQPQHAATRQQAKPVQQQQRQQATHGSRAGHGSIPEAKFRASFGSSHTFHVNRSQFANGGGRFQYGGFWFNVLNPWPVGWLYTDAVYVDYLNGGYFLCNPVHPGVYISINIG
jgi:hypothetical protein